jgi:hypothetical protein
MKMAMLALFLMAASVMGQAPEAGKRTTPKAGPRMVIDSMEHDLGVVRKSTGATHTFRFRNEGTSDLEIVRVVPG